MLLFIKLIIFFVVIWSVRFILTRDNFKKATRVNDEFEKWVTSDCKSKRPSNAEFSELYKEVYKNSHPTVDAFEANPLPGQIRVRKVKAGVLESFPSLNPQLAEYEFAALSNLKDYFYKKYADNFSFTFWIRLCIFLPSRIAEYIGFKDDHVSKKLINVIYWILISVVTFLRPLISQWVNYLLR